MRGTGGTVLAIGILVVSLYFSGLLDGVIDFVTDQFGGGEIISPTGDAESGDQPRRDIEWIISPRIESGVLEFAGSIQEQHRDNWTLCTDDQYGRFAIYDDFGQKEEPDGGILEPLSPGEYYAAKMADDVIASYWDVDCTSFHILAEVAVVWPRSFSVGIWGQHQKSLSWGLLDKRSADLR